MMTKASKAVTMQQSALLLLFSLLSAAASADNSTTTPSPSSNSSWTGEDWGFLYQLCKPVEGGHFTNLLQGFTPCITEVFVLGVAHAVMLILCITRIATLKMSTLYSTAALQSPRLHMVWLALGVLCAVVHFLQFNSRMAQSNTVSIYGGTREDHVEAYEYLCFLFGISAWVSFAAVKGIELRGMPAVVKQNIDKPSTEVAGGNWKSLFSALLVFAGTVTKLQFVWADDPDMNYFLFIFYVNFGCQALLVVGMGIQGQPRLQPLTEQEYEMQQRCTTSGYLSLDEDTTSRTDLPPYPEFRVSIINRLMFNWVTPLMAQGYKEPLVPEQVWDVDDSDRSSVLEHEINEAWEKEMKRDPSNPKLWHVLVDVYGRDMMLAGAFKVINDLSQFVGPFFLSLLLTIKPGETYLGFIYALGIFAGQVIGMAAENQFFQIAMKVGVRCRAALVSKVFHKALVLSHTGWSQNPNDMNNLVTSDCEALQAIFQSLHNIWSAPFRIILAMAMLFAQLGSAALIAPVILIAAVPIQAMIVRKVAMMTKTMLGFTDKRVKKAKELVGYVSVIKCYAWEFSCKQVIDDAREAELLQLRATTYMGAVNSTVTALVPVAVSVFTLAIYAVIPGNTLNAAVAFTSISLFGVLRMPLMTLPQLITQLTNAQVSMNRLSETLKCDEQELEPWPPVEPGQPTVEIKDGAYSWSIDAQEATLHDIDLQIPTGCLATVVGVAGSGKSSLLSAILGEMPESGKPDVHKLRGKVAYVPQKAWLFNASLKDNIILGLPFDQDKWDRAIEASCLESDLEKQFANGMYTEIGERGVNMSGGQRQRISIARAVYAEADTYLFDDPLSALDAKVARKVWDGCLGPSGCLAGTTRIVATNQLHFVHKSDKIILMGNSTIIDQGSYGDLMQGQGPFFQLIERTGTQIEEEEEDEEEKEEGQKEEEEKKKKKKKEKKSEAKQDDSGKLVRAEDQESGSVSGAVVGKYIKALGGTHLWCSLMLLYIVTEGLRVGASLWIGVWSGDMDLPKQGSCGEKPHCHEQNSISFYIGIYGLFNVLQIVFTFGSSIWLATLSCIAARTLHSDMLDTLLHAPMKFFWANPLGRIVNRFSKDTSDIDKMLAMALGIFLRGIFQLFSTFVLISFNTPFVMTVIVPLSAIFYMVYRYFQCTVREVKRMDATSRSPIYIRLSEGLDGLSTIHSYRVHEEQLKAMYEKVDNNIRFNIVNMSSNRWLSVRLELIGGCMIFACAILTVIQRGNSTDSASGSAQMGLTLSYALQITGLLTMVIRLASMTENSLNAVERVGAYGDPEKVGAEAPFSYDDDNDEGRNPPKDWPAKGDINFRSVSMRYRDDLPLALTDFSANIHSGERIGVCGRTGAGKSTLFSTLFRLVECEPGGSVILDGQDITRMGLHDLRNKVMIIPQEPVMFQGDVRYNLDPFGSYTDSAIWQALERANLKQRIVNMPGKLQAEVQMDGGNFSIGERQLVSLARALLRRARVLVLDEATASMDVETDAKLQRTLRTEFENTTMMIIAHRLNTIIDCNRIVVLDKGCLMEFDTPKKLLQNEDGIFFSLVQNTGKDMAIHLTEIANGCVDMFEGPNPAEVKFRELQEQKQALLSQLQHVEADLKVQCKEMQKISIPLLSRQLDAHRYPRIHELQSAAVSLRSALHDPAAYGLEGELEQIQVPLGSAQEELHHLVADLFQTMPAEAQAQATGGVASAYKEEVGRLVDQLYFLAGSGTDPHLLEEEGQSADRRNDDYARLTAHALIQ